MSQSQDNATEYRADSAAGNPARSMAEHTADTFAEIFGRQATGVWGAPGRVNAIGEHTDYNDGFVLPIALPHAAFLAVAARNDGLLRLHSAQFGGQPREVALRDLAPGAVDGWAGYLAGVVWALQTEGHPIGGADLHLDSTVPTGAGLSSSAALECVVALAFDELFQLGLGRPELARLAQRAENDFVGMPCGVLDQMASLCCTEGHAMFLDTRDLSTHQVPLDLAGAGLRLLVVDTLVKHAHAEGEYGKRRAGCEHAAAQLGVPALRDLAAEDLDATLPRLDDRASARLVRHVVTENGRVERVVALLRAGRVREIGPLLSEGHASLRDDFAVSCPELDLAVQATVAAGALGGRMTGGGFGGSAIVLVDEAAADRVADAVRTAFADAGHHEPRIFHALPSPGARRES